MGYITDDKLGAYFVHLEKEKEFNRLYGIFKNNKRKRIKKKIAKRIDGLVIKAVVAYG